MNLKIEGLESRLLAPAPEVAIDFGKLAGLDNYVAGHEGLPINGNASPNRAGAAHSRLNACTPAAGTAFAAFPCARTRPNWAQSILASGRCSCHRSLAEPAA